MGFIKFTQDRKTVEAQPQEFKAGRVYELPEASCERWLRRKVAEAATEADFKAQAKADSAGAGKAAAEKAAAEKAAAEKAAAEKAAAEKAAAEKAAAEKAGGVQTPGQGS